MLSLSEYHKMFTEHLEKYTVSSVPENLYAPVHYILSLGGKRIRPTEPNGFVSEKSSISLSPVSKSAF